MPDIFRKTAYNRGKAAEGGAPAAPQPAAGSMSQAQFSKAGKVDPRKKPIPDSLMKKHVK